MQLGRTRAERAMQEEGILCKGVELPPRELCQGAICGSVWRERKIEG
jgi:hypothetical protein